jgi:hypothetical protein
MSPGPLALSDSEITTIMAAARVLAPRDRDGFLRHIAQVLSLMPVRGDGSVHRAIAEVQRGYFDPPDLSGVAES